jgi:hypothetical protein
MTQFYVWTLHSQKLKIVNFVGFPRSGEVVEDFFLARLPAFPYELHLPVCSTATSPSTSPHSVTPVPVHLNP